MAALRSIHDVREMSFQNVVDKILKPAGLKMGGFPEEMFLDLTEAEQQSFMCNICYLIANEIRLCDNKHAFCRSCILAWSMTYGENADKCPLCRCRQLEYVVDKALENSLNDKRVRCTVESCSFKAPLRIYLMHSHGKSSYSNAGVDYDKLHDQRAQMSMPLPPIFAMADVDGANGPAVTVREQLLQGRMMIHQMMLLMHLEMQLRQQALTSYQEAQDPTQRMQRLDDVMALNEQLNEVGTILSTLLSVPLARGAASQRYGGTASRTQINDTVGRAAGDGTGTSSRTTPRQTSRFVSLHDSDFDDNDNVDDDNLSAGDDLSDGELSTMSDESFDASPQPLSSRFAVAISPRDGRDRPAHILNRRQEQSPSLTGVTLGRQNVEINEISQLNARQTQSTALPLIAPAQGLTSPSSSFPAATTATARGTPRTLDVTAVPVHSVPSGGQGTMEPPVGRSALSRFGGANQPSGGGAIRAANVDLNRSTNLTTAEQQRNGPITVPWPPPAAGNANTYARGEPTTTVPIVASAAEVTGPNLRSTATQQQQQRLTSGRAGTRAYLPAQRLRQLSVNTGNTAATEVPQQAATPAVAASDASRRNSQQQAAAGARWHPESSAASTALSGEVSGARRSGSTANWPAIRSLSHDVPGGGGAHAPVSRARMVPLPNPTRAPRSTTNAAGGSSGNRTSSSQPGTVMRPRRRSEIAHDLLFPAHRRQ